MSGDEEKIRWYEAECLDESRRLFEAWLRAPMAHGQELVYLEASLQGSYPDTRLVVVVDNVRTSAREAHAYPLWGKFFKTGYGDGREHPQGVATLVWSWLMEPLKEDDEFRGEIEILPP